MSNDVVVKQNQLANLEAAAREDAGFEKILKFKKGEYFIGEEEIAIGTEYLAHTVGWVKCWIKFVDGEVADRKLYRVAFGEKPPPRENLDDRNESKWPEGLDGNPADPWVLQYLLPLEDLKSGEIVVFVASSFGGKRAIADLCDGYTKRTKKTGCGQPIIKLAKADMPTKKFGKVPRPLFEVVGWDDTEVEFIQPSPPTSNGSSAPLNDEIPFAAEWRG